MKEGKKLEYNPASSDSKEDGFGNPIIFDFGSYSTKFGLYSQEKPDTLRSVLGIQILNGVEIEVVNDENSFYPFLNTKEEGIKYHAFGEDLDLLEKCQDVVHVFQEDGLVSNFHHFETYVDELVSNNQEKLHILSGDIESFWNTTPVDIIGGLFETKNQKEKKVSLFFEKYDIPSLHFNESFSSAMYYSSKMTTYPKNEVVIIVDIGQSYTRISPIFEEGYVYYQNATYLPIGGKDISNELIYLLSKDQNDQDLKFGGKVYFQKQLICDQLKERYCYFSMNYKFEKRCAENGFSSLFDCYKSLFHLFPVEIISIFHQFSYGPKNIFYKERTTSSVFSRDPIRIKEEQFVAPELYFTLNSLMKNKRSRFGRNNKTDGLINELSKIIQNIRTSTKDDPDPLKVTKLVFCGGGSLVRNFQERMVSEMNNCEAFKGIGFDFPEERDIIAWLGSKMFLHHEGVRNSFISKYEYDDAGPSVVHRRMGFC